MKCKCLAHHFRVICTLSEVICIPSEDHLLTVCRSSANHLRMICTSYQRHWPVMFGEIQGGWPGLLSPPGHQGGLRSRRPRDYQRHIPFNSIWFRFTHIIYTYFPKITSHYIPPKTSDSCFQSASHPSEWPVVFFFLVGPSALLGARASHSAGTQLLIHLTSDRRSPSFLGGPLDSLGAFLIIIDLLICCKKMFNW